MGAYLLSSNGILICKFVKYDQTVGDTRETNKYASKHRLL